MKRLELSGLSMIVLAFSAVGCCDKEKADLAAMTRDRNELSEKMKGLQGDLSMSKEREANLMAQVTQKDGELTVARSENTDLKTKLAAKPVGPGPVVKPGESELYRGTVEGDVLFAAGHADLTANGKAELDKILADVKKSAGPGTVIRVVGHTDSDPIVKTKNLWKDNLDLSANRAMEVTRHLWSKGVSAEHVETVAMGATHFVGANSSKTAKAANRRVEIVVVKR